MSDVVEVTVDSPPTHVDILRGRDTLRLGGGAMFDRVVNLRLIRESGESFNIRSDYEPVYGADGSVSFKRCLEKPHIKVSYEQVPGNTVINCAIEVTNLFLDPRVEGSQEASSRGEGKKPEVDRATGEASILENNGDPVRSIVLQMGYINQFPDWSRPDAYDHPTKLRKFFAMDNHVFDGDPRAGAAVELHLMVLSTEARSLPPDKVTFFDCVVGSLYPGMTWKHQDTDLLDSYGDIAMPKEGMTGIERALFMLVTRRFIDPDLRYSVSEDGTALLVSAPFVTSGGETIYGDATEQRPVKVDLAPDGCLATDAAQTIGVQCLASQKLREAYDDKSDTFISGLMTRENDFAVTAGELVRQQTHLGAQLEQIKQVFPRIRWFVLNSGDYFFYSSGESSEDLFKDVEVKLRQERQVVTLPAIYDMTVDGMRQVRAPFHGFINPLTTVRVNARYNIGTLVGFFYPKPRHFWLVVILQKVEFSTAGDENLMELSCIDIDPNDAPHYDPASRKTTVKHTELSDRKGKRSSRFDFTIESWEVYKTNGAHSRLSFIAQEMVESAKARPMAKLWREAGKVPTVPLAIAALLKRNSALLDTQARKDRGNAPEYETYKAELNSLGVYFVPYLYESFNGKQDVIKYRLPWAPDDDGTLGEVRSKSDEGAA
jgi:hypothetical protein